MAELDRTRDQLGHPPNWTGPARRMAELDRTRDQFGGWPSWNDRAVFIPSFAAPPLRD
ncbi:hypothetical protein DY000_02059919 [Brassica cretica]|uniref:Uncharacterized protein n=1 Tax=Brassica cretica TaxID=69181 RepID=A0ABQ7AQW1_BRACR|nr:hypothetical protein DY000_02059919 [Brassica cretica]